MVRERCIRPARSAPWWAPITLSLLLAGPLFATTGDAARDAALDRLLDAVWGSQRAVAETRGREMFAAVVSQPSFEHAAVGCFDLYVYTAGALGRSSESRKVLAKAAAGLQPAADMLARQFDAPATPGAADALVAGRRFPIVLTSGPDAYQQLVALIDRCEDDGFSDWKPANAVWTSTNLAAEVTRTWEVQVFNLAHDAIESQGPAWSEHGLGYYAIAHVANRLLRQGAWGNVPPWLAQGLIDELDIEAYGEAWVGGDWYTTETAGWSRPGWSGFVPQGCSPPPPVTGPPAELAVTVKKSGRPWEQREASSLRHWAELAADRRSEAPASFAFMAQHESFFPRDRAFARCLLHVVLDVLHREAGGLLRELDHAGRTDPNGMPDRDPLPAIFARSLGGIPAVDELEAQSLQAMLATIGRDALADRIRALGADELLALPDHRSQAEWLYRHPEFAADVRGQLFSLILEAEYHQQLREWKLIGERLDAGAAAAFKACGSYPRGAADRAKVAKAFRSALSMPTTASTGR